MFVSIQSKKMKLTLNGKTWRWLHSQKLVDGFLVLRRLIYRCHTILNYLTLQPPWVTT